MNIKGLAVRDCGAVNNECIFATIVSVCFSVCWLVLEEESTNSALPANSVLRHWIGEGVACIEQAFFVDRIGTDLKLDD